MTINLESISDRLSALEQKDAEKDLEIDRLRSTLAELLPSRDEHIRAMAEAIKKGNKKRIRELNNLNAVKMGLKGV